MSKVGAIIGVSDHGGWAVLVTMSSDGQLLDRRRVELVDEGLPKIPHHHEAQTLPVQDAIELIERVRESAHRHAIIALDVVAAAVPVRIVGIALRVCPALPPTIEERLKNYRAQNVADWVMYRNALANAAIERAWSVYWYDAKQVFATASAVLKVNNLDAHYIQLRKSIGPPWNSDHKLAMSAAITANYESRTRG